MSTRAEEVAKELCQNSVYGCFQSETAKYLSSLPEFQPGRELTGQEIHVAYSQADTGNNIWKQMAAELNKIRAPKADEAHMIENLAIRKERDELKAMNEKLRVDIRCADDAKAALQTAYNELKAHPVGVTKEQVKAAFKSLEWTGYDTDDCRQKLAAALSPKWLKCSERMPEKGQSCFLYCESGSLISDKYDAGFFTTLTHWQPRYVPAPPVEEESIELQELREHVQSWNLVMAKKVIDAFIAYEKGTK